MKKIACFAVCLSLNPAVVQAMGLLDAYMLARDKDPTLQAAYHTHLANEQLRPAAIGTLLPQITASATQTTSQDKSSTVNTQISKSHSKSLSLTQTIINFGLWYDLMQANNLVDEGQATYIAAEQALMVNVTDAYLNVLRAKDVVSFNNAKRNAVSKQLEETRQKYKVGLVAVTDVREAKARFDSATADVTQAKNDLEDSKDALQEITGEYPHYVEPLKRKLPLLPPEPLDVSSWIMSAKERNPTVLAARSAAQAAREGRNSEYANHLPTLSLSGSKGKSRLGTFSSPRGGFEESWSTSLELSLNIFSGGTITANARRASYQYQASLDELERTIRSTVKNTSTAYRGIQSAISRIQSLRQAVLSSKTALKASRAAYEVGTRTSVDVLNSITDLFNNQQRLTEAKLGYILNQLLLKQAAGTITQQDLIEIDALLVKMK